MGVVRRPGSEVPVLEASPRRWCAVLGAALLLGSLAACGGSAPDPGTDAGPGSPGRSSDAASPSSLVSGTATARPSAGTSSASGQDSEGEQDGELTASQAAKMGVLHGRYDARLTRARLVDGKGSVRLTNVGTDPDIFDVTLDPAGGGIVDPVEVPLQPGKSALLTVQTHLSSVTVHVTSRGREGAPVADAELAEKGSGR